MNLWKSFHNATLTGITNIKNTFKLGGTEVTATAAELNALDGITATVSELNILSGVTAAAAELNYNDITTLGTGAASKAVVLNASGDYTYPASATIVMPSGGTETFQSGSTLDVAGTFQIGGVTVDATAAELNRATDISTRVVTTTATTLSLTVTAHGDRVVLVNTNSTVANTLSLPAAAGTGVKFTVVNGIAQTQGSIVVAANGTDVMKGIAMMANSSTTVNAIFALTSASSDKVTLNRTTTGGAGPGDYIECWDIAANTWLVRVAAASVGDAATPFSET